MEYVFAAESAPVDSVPDVARDPVQPPDAVHEVAFVDDQVSVDVPPVVTLVGFAVRDTVGAGGLLPPSLPPPPPPQLASATAQPITSSRASIRDMIEPLC